MSDEARDRKVALVTGGGRGIGAAIARDLAIDHDVAVTCLTSAAPSGMFAVQADLAVSHAPKDVIANILDRFGRLDVIVNNAGVIAFDGPDDYDLAALQQMFAVNLFAAKGLLTAALPHLGQGAAIVSISSVNAVLQPMGAAMYGATKAALNTWTRGMAKELGPRGIRVNAVAPGAIEDPAAPRPPDLVAKFQELTALGALATQEDIAAAVRFLASDNARAITGEILTVSGGYRL